jgi:hypothetical protein
MIFNLVLRKAKSKIKEISSIVHAKDLLVLRKSSSISMTESGCVSGWESILRVWISVPMLPLTPV